MNEIRVIRRNNARRIIARRKDSGEITVTVPSGMSEQSWRPIADGLIADLQRNTPAEWSSRFSPGQRIDCGDFCLSLSVQSRRPNAVTAERSANKITIGIGSGLRIGERTTDMTVNRLLLRVAASLAPAVLIPQARRVAEKTGVEVREWRIGRGHRTLGTCSSDGRITLSAINVFLPEDLREYIICHELAHRSEMNHSARFHRLCDSYLQGRERQLNRKLKTFKWPIIR